MNLSKTIRRKMLSNLKTDITQIKYLIEWALIHSISECTDIILTYNTLNNIS